MSEAKVLCPKGSKVCPKCKRFVKGPRTRVCTHQGCGHVFIKGERVSVVAKARKVVAPAKPVEPEVVRIPDPFTFNEVVAFKGEQIKGSFVVRNAAGCTPNPKGDSIMEKRRAKLVPVEFHAFPSIVELA